MTHLPYIVAAFSISLVVPITFAVLAQTRLARARRRLATLDPRARPKARQ